jgi:ABC-type transport system involved in cytochrome bd biosynthesis fused ATPase/permease subunit
MWGGLVVGISAERSGHLNGVLLAVIALIPLSAFELVSGLPGATQTLQRVRRSAARVLEVIDSPVAVRESLDPVAVGPAPHTVRVRGLRARYLNRAEWALDGVDLDLTPGRRVAVVGPSGAGKSTLAAVLLGFLPYQQGSVTLDGVELAELDGDQYRRVIGLVAQDAHIFDNTLEENLRLARREATEDQLRGVLDRVRLLDWAAGLPRGLATALLADFPVLVLDEPDEHLDAPTADAMLADLLDVTSGRTTLLITHRLAGLEQLDEVLVLDAGRVVERGTHAELVGAGGRYARLWAGDR